MRQLLSSPVKMPLSGIENQIYQNALKYISEISLNLMAVKVENRPQDFLGWCIELNNICEHGVNRDLLDEPQFKPLKKLQEILQNAISIGQLKMSRVTPWPVYAGFIEQHAELQSVQERLRLLEYIEQLTQQSLADMNAADRLVYCGKHTSTHAPEQYNFDVEWFASTKAAKSFHRLMSEHPELFDQALTNIPLVGDVTDANYKAFVSRYQGIFAEHGDGDKAPLAPATRLLAMRRPDQFVALNNAKMDCYSQAFAISRLNNQGFDTYWHELIATIRVCPWYQAAMPQGEQEELLVKYRALMLDVFLFAKPDQAEQSNYLRMKNKPKKAASIPRAMKRSKESAAQIVDKALEAEGMPEYLVNNRNSIISSVEQGKSVTQVISLMKTIFGG
ncbi:hypothetical protein FE810_14750 [Thalassotalea litorea]|uniref:Orphan protein n=1 Tax=Thalassotalea litorea TaxID=2020715 RepID=A0A5R9ID31_9GAMM|nr:hypothetical protein [Thalassotalea litorea]TLU61491.1 hypothetical protein FE810_14750 [Thalassotalea litorea]